MLSAQKIKLINNFVFCGAATLIAEALRTCDRVGVSREALYALMSKGALSSGLLQSTAGEILNGNYAGVKFSIGNASKDLSYFNNLIAEFGGAESLAPDVARVLKQAVDRGQGDQFLPELAR